MDKNKLLKRIAVFTGVSLTAMHVFNRISTYIATADNLLGADDYNVYDWKYGKISYKKKGAGTPLLLIHNFNVFSSSHEWNKITFQQQTLYILLICLDVVVLNVRS